MNILYIHGFGSKYDPTHEKVMTLEKLGTVFGVNVDYTLDYHLVYEKIVAAITEYKIDLIVGTSMGGYMAAQTGSKIGLPFVAINPAITPVTSLLRWEGNHTGYNDKPFTLSKPVIETYPDIAKTGCGLVLLDRADEVISASLTLNVLRDCFETVIYSGGNHRFTHMTKSLDVIREHYENSKIVYGLDESS
jgi:predicted esterase YcpF (UPF0227 family)